MISLGMSCKSTLSGNTTLMKLAMAIIRSSLKFYYQLLNESFNASARRSNPGVRTAASKKTELSDDFRDGNKMHPDTDTLHKGYCVRKAVRIGTFSIAPTFTANAFSLMIIFSSRIIHFYSQLARFIHLITSNLFMSSVIKNITIIYSVLVKKQKIKGETLAA